MEASAEMFSDSHAHLDDDRFSEDLDEVLARAKAEGVDRIVTVGTGLESCRAAIGLAAQHPDFVFAAVGIHPHDADETDDAAMEQLAESARRAGVVAVGETGLDYHYENSTRDGQKRLFRAHIRLALETGLPLIVHCREAHDDCLSILEERRREGLRGVAHCFSGGPEIAERFLDLGFHISFAGTLTFPNARDVREAARSVPLDRVLIETDCPYLAPRPRRGRRNEPAFLPFVAGVLAELRGLEARDVGRVTGRNAGSLFGVGRTCC